VLAYFRLTRLRQDGGPPKRFARKRKAEDALRLTSPAATIATFATRCRWQSAAPPIKANSGNPGRGPAP